jgi:hypothetical protein
VQCCGCDQFVDRNQSDRIDDGMGWDLCVACGSISNVFLVQRHIAKNFFLGGGLDVDFVAVAWASQMKEYMRFMNSQRFDSLTSTIWLSKDGFDSRILRPMALLLQDGKLCSLLSEPSFPSMVERRKLWWAISLPYKDGTSAETIRRRLQIEEQGEILDARAKLAERRVIPWSETPVPRITASAGKPKSKVVEEPKPKRRFLFEES